MGGKMTEFFYNYDAWKEACLKRGWTLEPCPISCDESCGECRPCYRIIAIDPKTGNVISIFKDLLQMGVIYDE